MKKIVFSILALVLALQSGICQQKASVYFMRSTGYYGSATSYTAFIDGELVCKLNNKRYSVHEVDEGKHAFVVQFGGNSVKSKSQPIIIDVEEGEIYYIQMVFEKGLMGRNLYCQEVTKSSADNILRQLSQDKNCD